MALSGSAIIMSRAIPADVRINYNDSDKKWHATMNATADQLKAAPEFKYNGRWNASKS